MESSAPECKHCWHPVQMHQAKPTIPPLYGERCCVCGDTHFTYQQYAVVDPLKHGPYLYSYNGQ
jgi:hypothetical protein